MGRKSQMYHYPKCILTSEELVQKLSDSGMEITDKDEAIKMLNRIGYYRLKGYSYHLYNRQIHKYQNSVSIEDILCIYQFDRELSHIVFFFISQIEIALRAELVNALLSSNDILILNDPSIFSDKSNYWKNQSAVAGEIARSKDVFIKHNFDNHDGAIPLWAAVEVMSFGTLSKIIKNLKPSTEASRVLRQNHKFKNERGNLISPNHAMLSSWIQSISIVRNICAHNGRLYNRAISTSPQLLNVDRLQKPSQFSGLYPILLAMKYLRPSDRDWVDFTQNLQSLLDKYSNVVEIRRLNFPSDWEQHFQL